jgi:hypothetical protein
MGFHDLIERKRSVDYGSNLSLIYHIADYFQRRSVWLSKSPVIRPSELALGSLSSIEEIVTAAQTVLQTVLIYQS